VSVALAWPARRPLLGRAGRAFAANKTSAVGLVLFAIVVLVAAFAPLLAPHDPLDQQILHRLEPPSTTNWLGTDSYGRDTLSRLLLGARVSLLVGLASMAAAMLVGGTIGVVAGYLGGWVDMAAMRVMDALLSFPSLIMGLIVVAMLGPSLTNLVIAIALTAVGPFARIARGPTIAVREREFIQACRALGFSDRRIMALHVLPNVFADILVMGTLWLATAIRVEASLSFIGLGLPPPTPSWGGMIRDGFEHILESGWLAVAPSTAILVVVFALNLLGDGLRDVIDPKLRGD
jgi:peptide/nickel transport system permease protein